MSTHLTLPITDLPRAAEMQETLAHVRGTLYADKTVLVASMLNTLMQLLGFGLQHNMPVIVAMEELIRNNLLKLVVGHLCIDQKDLIAMFDLLNLDVDGIKTAHNPHPGNPPQL